MIKENEDGETVIDHEALEELLDLMEERYDIERSEHAEEVGRMVANLQD